MAELRIGHEQVSFRIDELRFNDGALLITAGGYADTKLIKKLTGDQPLVIVCDDGSIWGAWHADCTKNWKEARSSPSPQTYITFNQRFENNGIVSTGKK
jgi:hypothetical protein